MKPEAKVDISPKRELSETRREHEQLTKTHQSKKRSTSEVIRKSRLQLDELDMIVTNRGTYYFQN